MIGPTEVQKERNLFAACAGTAVTAVLANRFGPMGLLTGSALAYNLSRLNPICDSLRTLVQVIYTVARWKDISESTLFQDRSLAAISCAFLGAKTLYFGSRSFVSLKVHSLAERLKIDPKSVFLGISAGLVQTALTQLFVQTWKISGAWNWVPVPAGLIQAAIISSINRERGPFE